MDTKQLAEELYHAINTGDENKAEKVMVVEQSTYWRFKCPDGIFYTVTDENTNWPKTVFTQSMIRAIKKRRKLAKRKTHSNSPFARR